MMTRFIYAFLERYRDAPAITKAKAKVILVYNTVVLLAILFSLIVVQVIITPNLRNAAIDGAWILCLLLVLYALYRGAIRAASNVSIALNMVFLAVLGFMADVGSSKRSVATFTTVPFSTSAHQMLSRLSVKAIFLLSGDQSGP